MRIIDLTLNDLAQIFRDKRAFIFLLAMPLVFTLFMGYAYRSGEDGAPQDPRMPLAWVQAGPVDDLSQRLYTRLEDSQVLTPLPMERDAALAALESGEVAGVLVLPSGIGEQASASLVSSQASGNTPWQATLITDPASITGQSLYQVLRLPVTQLMSSVEIGQMSAEALGNPSEATPALDLAWQGWETHSSQSQIRLEQAVAQSAAPAEASWFGDNPYNQASPGILVQFAIMGLVTTAQILVRERQSRTLQRLMTTALKPAEILVGHMLAMFVIVFAQTALLVIFGQLVLGVAYLSAPLSVLLVAVALSLWVACMGLLIGVLAKGDEQVVMFAMITMFLFSALGGSWFPLETTGRAFATLGKLLPSAWAMTGFQNVLIRGLGLGSAWLPTGILLAYALGFFLLTTWRFRRLES